MSLAYHEESVMIKTRFRLSVSLFIGWCWLLGVVLLAMPNISTAQPIFATNTPRPPDPLDIFPSLPQDRYALRLWSAPQLIDVLISLLHRGDSSPEFYTAVQLIQYELTWRFPNAPQDTITRQQLYTAMLSAPRGSADMRFVARPLALAGLQTGQMDMIGIKEVARLNMDGDGFADILYQLRYPADEAQPYLYLDYVIIKQDADGRYSLPNMPQAVFAAPYQDVLGVDLLAIGDYTSDGLDEAIIRLDRGGANDRMVIYGWRNGAIIDLALPTTPLEFGDVVSIASGNIGVNRYEVESDRWGCYRARRVDWVWSTNFFRPIEAGNTTLLVDTIGCQMVAIQPLYGQSPANALRAVENILNNHPSDATGYPQVVIATAMLQWLNGDRAGASLRIIGLKNQPNLSLHIQRQISIFEALIAQNASPIRVCAELTANNGACEIDQLIGRNLTENPISRTGSLTTQLESLGLPIRSIVTVTQVGRADRQVVTFNLPNTSQWAFAPLNTDTYTAEKLGTVTIGDNQNRQSGDIPTSALQALLVNNDGISALNIIDNAIRQNPALADSYPVQFFRALCFDLIGNRSSAVSEYYQLWRIAPDSLWGRLAGAHLESR